MAQRTAIQQAKETFDKLTKLKINRTPLPASQVKKYAVATLPNGQVLMSTGKTKSSASSKKVEKAKRVDRESLAPIGQKQKMAAAIGDLLLQIAIPEQQIGTGTSKMFTFANYVNQILRPKLPTAPGIGAPALLPDPRTVSRFYTPSAIANLPPLVKRVEDSFESPLAKYGTFIENTAKIQQELAKKFLSQFNRGERPAAYAAMGGRATAPLTAGYKAGAYILPEPKSATSAAIKPQTPTFNAASIY